MKSGCFFFVFLIKKRKVLVAEEKSDLHLHKGELLKYHESFPILVFEEILSIEIAL